MMAVYEHFPELKIHRKEFFTSSFPNKKFQERLMQVFRNVNGKTFTFEEIGNPTVPGCTVIFELGIADAKGFSYVDEEEIKKVLTALKKEPFKMMDFFCVIRYYKDYASSRKPLKFDYYMARFIFAEENMLEIQIFHERGPRYVPPKALTTFLSDRINETSPKAILKEAKGL
jgi:hypothetical protein